MNAINSTNSTSCCPEGAPDYYNELLGVIRMPEQIRSPEEYTLSDGTIVSLTLLRVDGLCIAVTGTNESRVCRLGAVDIPHLLFSKKGTSLVGPVTTSYDEKTKQTTMTWRLEFVSK